MKWLTSLLGRFRRPGTAPSPHTYAKHDVVVLQDFVAAATEPRVLAPAGELAVSTVLPTVGDVLAGKSACLHGTFATDEQCRKVFIKKPAPQAREYGPGHPDWAGRAEIPLVRNGWAEPGHPMFVYQQFLKYQNDGTFPEGWKVVGWTPEGVSYLVPPAHWTEKERLNPHPTVRNAHNPYRGPDEVARERLKAARQGGMMSDAEIDERVAQYRAYTTSLNEQAAEILDTVRYGAERHARTLLDNNEELYETVAGFGRPGEVEANIDAWVKECGQRAVDKRLADTKRLLGEHGLLRAIPTDNHVYEPIAKKP